MNFNLESLKNIYESYLVNDYIFIDFHSEIDQKKNIILRHDIDFDIEKAHQVAKLESDMGITSTFFFLLRSDSYNFLEKKNLDYVLDIKNKGHEISIHYDPTLYSDFYDGLENELFLFEKITGVNPRIISFHRPSKQILDNNSDILGLPHTYQDKYFKDIKYISDSGGGFFYDDPINCPEFKNNFSIQLLIHPIWWTTKGNNNIEKIKEYISSSNEELSLHIEKNCIPWRKFSKK